MKMFDNNTIVPLNVLLGIAEYGYEEDMLVVDISAKWDDLSHLDIGQIYTFDVCEKDLDEDTTHRYSVTVEMVENGFKVINRKNM